MFPSKPATSGAKLAASITGTLRRSTSPCTSSGVTSAETPRMHSVLKMLLPIALPTATSPEPLKTAPSPTASSGLLVPSRHDGEPADQRRNPQAPGEPHAAADKPLGAEHQQREAQQQPQKHHHAHAADGTRQTPAAASPAGACRVPSEFPAGRTARRPLERS